MPHAARHEPDAGNIPDGEAETIEQGLLAAERHAALREAFTHLAPRDQQLITLLIEDPPVPYAEISTRLGIPVGSIGPNRRRCLDKLRHHPAIAALISAEAPHNDCSRADRTSQAPVVANVQIRRLRAREPGSATITDRSDF